MASFSDIQHEISNMLDIPDEDLDESQRAELDAYLAELAQAESDKVDAFSSFVRLELGRAEAIKKEAQYLSKRARAIENRIDSLKAYYLRTMLDNNLTKVQGQTHKISLRNTKAVCIEDAAIDALPVEFVKVERTPMKTAIKKALESGQEIAGCSIVERQSLMVA